ncbi:MAG: 30S ribosomal protein S2 [Deltaproteobacteria bacterium]|nr:30S ribosomal protein S2 [Deltaproteobacteria bacterium]
MTVSLRELLEAGVHFGHQTRRWNPKMRPYIYGQKNRVHIIDLQKTARALVDASRFVTNTVARGKAILFVGTKRAAQEIVASEAHRAGMFYVNYRWLGGTLTNFQTVRRSIERLTALERARDEGRFELISKKDALGAMREIEKMERALGGIKEMKDLPGALFIIDPKREVIAVREAIKLGIHVVGLCDTNCDPDGITHVIPGNDDAIKSIQLFTTAIADACVEGALVSRSEAPVVTPRVDESVEIVRRRAVHEEAREEVVEEVEEGEE